MFIDFKVTGWDRAKLNLNQTQTHKLMKALQDGRVNSANDLVEIAEEIGIEIDWEYLVNTQEQLNPSDNNGQATIEGTVMSMDGKEHTVYLNAIKYEKTDGS